MNFKDELYGKLPVKVQNRTISLYGGYWKSNQKASLRRPLFHDIERVPFYR